jgi:Cu/Ag efflux protein CusF
MKRYSMTVSMLGLLLLGVHSASAQTAQTKVTQEAGKATVAQLVEASATIAAIDAATRTITLKDKDGALEDVVAGPEVRNFAELKVGDEVHFQFYESLSLHLDKVVDGTPSASETTSEARAEPGEMPGGIKTRTVTLTAKVTAIDPKTKTVTLVGPKGRSVPVEVDDQAIANVKVGDLVRAVYTEAVAISVSRVEVH